MATLLAICQDVLRSIGQFNVPSTIYGSTDPTAVNLLALANRSGKALARLYDWQRLIATYTFSTASSTETYALPSAFGKFANLTQWNRSQYARMEGPVSAQLYEALRSGSISAVGGVQYFRIAANLFSIYPTPTAIETIAYQYYSTQWITSKTAFSDDADEPLLDPDLMALDIRWQFLRAKGLPYDDERAEFLILRDRLIADDGGKNVIRFGGGSVPQFADNIPDTGVGA